MKWILLCFVLTACSNKKELRLEPVIEGHQRSEYEAFGAKYMISTQGGATTEAAKFAFDRGGNVFDAAAAATFAISVERPHSTGIGGGGFMVMHHGKTKTAEAVDFREMAPLKSHDKMYLNKDGSQDRKRSIVGALASGTPGLVAGIVEIHQKYGKLPLATVLEPAIKLAADGFPIYPALFVALKAEAKNLCKFRSSKEIFLNSDCTPKAEGSLLKQTDLANTLRVIAKQGANGFYKGDVANKIVKYQKEINGLISHKDLEGYQVKWRRPIEGTFRGKKIVSMPPPSSGGVHIIQILNILENFDLKAMGAQSAKAIHLTSSAMQIAFADRAEHLGDSDFKPVPISRLADKKYAKILASKIKMNKALASKDFPTEMSKAFKEPEHTTHFTIMDNKGNIVTSTQTINGWFGSAVTVPGTGIILNNEMDDFASHVGGVNLFGAIGGKNNLVEPLKRPLSSMSPSIVFNEDGSPMMALGTPSGTRILTCVMQTILNVVEHRMPLWEAVAATRYHHQWAPEEIRIGNSYFDDKVIAKLKSYGHKINKKSLGCKIQAIKIESDGKLHGVSDPREEGRSFGI